MRFSAARINHGFAGRRLAALGFPFTGEFRTEVRQTGRGERDSPATNDLPITMRLSEPPEPSGWLKSA